MSDMAFVTIVDGGPRLASFYLTGATCLNQLAAIARYFDADTKISMFVGHTDAKWKGRGTR